MSIDLARLGSKLRSYREELQLTRLEVSQATGISEQSLADYEAGLKEPSGDDLLILSDFYKCDYKFFISNESVPVFERVQKMFRKHGDELSKSDRMAFLEFLYLCECEEQLLRQLHSIERRRFHFRGLSPGELYVEHGRRAAKALRKWLGYKPTQVPSDVFSEFRRLGFHVFRRKLGNSNISGLYVRHPFAGECILINYDEDVFRQRFTLAHEIGHALLDQRDDVELTMKNQREDGLIEARAYRFASEFLVPRELLLKIAPPGGWNPALVLTWAGKLMVNPVVLARALGEANLIEQREVAAFSRLRLPRHLKRDPELAVDLSPNSRQRRQELLERGLSNFYVKLCFDAYEQGVISFGRLANMLLVDEREVLEIAALFGRAIYLGD